jgi:uncharacterized protein YndB with AHSA1/START domain
MTPITIQTRVRALIEKVWSHYTQPQHITKWNAASPDWHTPRATNDLRPGGSFSCRMEAKDGSAGFDFAGVYDEVKPNELIRYTMEDGRKVSVTFVQDGDAVRVVTTFDPESENPPEMQRGGWQSILDSFKSYVEAT